MSQVDCATVRELIPDVASGRPGTDDRGVVDTHAAGCEECREELALARLLFESRPVASPRLAARVIEAVRSDRRMGRRPWWGISAAAVAALALGIGITSEPAADGPAELGPDVTVELEEGELWLSDDGLLAGAPVFDGLSDEALAELLEELISTPTGGAA